MAQFMGRVDAFDGAKPIHAFGSRVRRQATVGDFAPNVKEIQIGLIDKTVIFADQTGGITGPFPALPGVGCAFGHGGFIAPATMLMRIFACPKRNTRRHTERMGGESMLVKHSFVR